MKKIVLLILIFVVFPVLVLGATIFTDDFNSYSTGDLTGQGSWSGDIQFDVQNSNVLEGANAVSAILDNGQDKYISKLGSAQSDGSSTVYLMVSEIGSNWNAFGLRDSVNGWMCPIRWIDDKLYYGSNWAYTQFADSLIANTWYGVMIEWRDSDDKCNFRLENESPTDWKTNMQANSDSPETWAINSVGDGGLITTSFDFIDEEWYIEEEEAAVDTTIYNPGSYVLIFGYSIIIFGFSFITVMKT